MTRLLIVGGGIAGLVLGNALLKHRPDIDFQVIEKAPVLRAAGAGLILAPNGLTLLDTLGFREPLREHGQFLQYNQLCDHQGNSWQRIVGPDRQLLAFHRAELLQMLQAPLQGYLQTGKALEDLQTDGNQVHARFSGGHGETFDLVVGADGLRSRVRERCQGPHPVYSGYTSWRTVMEGGPSLSGASELWGHGRRLGLVPLTGGRIYLYFTLNAPAGKDLLQGDPSNLRGLFAEFQGADHGVLEHLTSTTPVIHTEISDLPLPFWGKGRVLLIGDAAHALTPNLGQGAGMGIEDGVLLARLLAKRMPLEGVLPEFRRIRHARARQVLLVSRFLGRLGQIQHPLGVRLRNQVMNVGPGEATPDWLWHPRDLLNDQEPFPASAL